MIGIIGLGLIGGSIAKAIDEEVVGFDSNQTTIEKAVSDGVIKKGYTDLKNVDQCDFVIISLPFATQKEILQTCKFKAGATIMDVCGIKKIMDFVPQDLDYVSTHPMAGKEVGGYENSDKDLFAGANFIITRRDNTSEKAIKRVEKLAQDLGCGHVFETNKEHHDEMIGFTSQLPHVLASCIVNTKYYQGCNGFEGGSLADFTRIARMDSAMWADLFLNNKGPLLEIVENLKANINKVENFLIEEDKIGLRDFLENGSKNREEHE